MQTPLFSSQWYRVASLRPRVRAGVVTDRHYYRGTVWYIVGAKSSKSHLRINAAAFYLFSQFDGERTVETIWQSALGVLGDDAPSQEETQQLLGVLFDASVIDVQWQSDVDRMFDNHQRKRMQEVKSRYWNPLSLRFALLDPDRLTQKLLPACGWLFTPRAFQLWLLLVVVGAITAAYAWTDLTAELTSDLVAPGNLVILWIVFPLMKALHELAHALAVKRWGGEVHECGIALLVLMPVPYVDASESARFGSKYRRMAVAGAGIIVETSLAVIGLFVWLAVEPGLVRDVAFNVMLTGSVSSLLFNGNPLLKFDAYYVLSDLIEIPSLASRSSAYLLHLLKRYAFGLVEISPVTAQGEGPWFVAYGLAATVYRLVLTAGICLFVASHYFFVGVGLAVWALVMQIVLPIGRGLRFVANDSRLQGRRVRAELVTAALVVGLGALMFYVPIPNTTQVRGVVWPVDEAMVRAGADCFVEDVLVENGVEVDVGTKLARCDATLLEAEVAKQRAEQLAARAALFASRDRVERSLKQSELNTVSELLSVAEENLERTTMSAAAPGHFFAPDALNLVGRFFGQGAVVGYVLNRDNIAIRVMLDQERVALLGDRLDDVQIRTARDPSVSLPSRVLRRVPSATDRLVTPALGADGGGDLALDSTDPEGLRLAMPAFELELALPDDLGASLVGEAVDVRFDHGRESLAALLFRELRLLLLRRFDV